MGNVLIRAPLATIPVAMSDLSPAERSSLHFWEMALTFTSASIPLIDVTPGRAKSARASRERLDAIARVLDSAFVIPGTRIRVGADAILNLLPGVGTLASKALSGYLIYEARRLGVPNGTLLRMAGNVGIDFLIGAVPVIGWVGDVFHRANLKNMRLLREHLDRQAPARGPVIDGTVL